MSTQNPEPEFIIVDEPLSIEEMAENGTARVEDLSGHPHD